MLILEASGLAYMKRFWWFLNHEICYSGQRKPLKTKGVQKIIPLGRIRVKLSPAPCYLSSYDFSLSLPECPTVSQYTCSQLTLIIQQYWELVGSVDIHHFAWQQWDKHSVIWSSHQSWCVKAAQCTWYCYLQSYLPHFTWAWQLPDLTCHCYQLSEATEEVNGASIQKFSKKIWRFKIMDCINPWGVQYK